MQGSIHQILRCIAGRLILALLLPAACAAQRESLKFDLITSEQGLSDNYVLCALQDRHGFMWFGTRDGLNSYDGHRFTIYRYEASDSHSISDGSVNCMFEDHAGRLWIGTHSRGLNMFDRIRQRFLHYQHDPNDQSTIPAGRVAAICEDAEQNLWVLTTGPGAGLARLDRSRRRFTRFRHDPRDPGSLSSDAITSVTRDAFGAIWVGTDDRGLNRYEPVSGRFINHHTMPGYSFDSLGMIRDIVPDTGGTLWLHRNNALHPFDVRSGRAAEAPGLGRVVENVPSTIHRDRSGTLWIGTMLGGLAAVESGAGGVRSYRKNDCDRHGLASDRIFCITEDRAGNLWFGTDCGINKLDRRSGYFHHYQHDPFDPLSLSHNRVRSILEDGRGNLWIGTGGGGVNRLGPGARGFERYRSDPRNRRSLSDNTVNVIYQDRRGDVWLGTNNGLNRYDPATDGFVSYRYDAADPTSLGPGGVWSIMEDRDGEMWIGQLTGGLSRFDRSTGRFIHYPQDRGEGRSPNDNNILCMLEDRDGIIWLGTDHGVNRFDKRAGRFTWLHHDPRDPGSLNNDRVWYIHQDRLGTLWFGTSGGGLSRYSPADGKFRAYTDHDGLAHNLVCGILEDDRGMLWISTNKGISRFNPATGEFRNHTAGDGLYISEFHFKTCFRDAAGRMYFGGTDGAIRFHPESLGRSRFITDVALTSFKIFDQEVRLDTSITLKREIRLEHGSNFFSLEFAALDLTNPLANRYKYRLEGFDLGWRRTDGARPYASYTNVPPGRYTFRVRASNSDGVWNDGDTVVEIIIEPAFWQTWWFQGASAMAACALIGAVGFIRIRSVRRQGETERRVVEYRLKALRAQMNPHFIFNSLNSILAFIITHDSESAHTYLSKFSRLIRFTLENSINESITLADEIESLRFYLELEMLRFDDSFVYEIVIDPAIDTRTVEIPPMLMQPYAENAIKYGLAYRESPGRLLIDIRKGQGEIICSVADNGIGRERAATLGALHPGGHKSRGMQVTKERLDALNALTRNNFSVEVIDLHENGLPCGTRIDIHIPITTARPLTAPEHYHQ